MTEAGGQRKQTTAKETRKKAEEADLVIDKQILFCGVGALHACGLQQTEKQTNVKFRLSWEARYPNRKLE